MPAENEDEVCPFCGGGRLVKNHQEIAFRQQTKKGCVFCRVTVPMGVCVRCGSKTFIDPAESIVEDAVRREYEKLP
jgi:RNA polymerase subunit RPABC4/transcription elongation factor Spt4